MEKTESNHLQPLVFTAPLGLFGAGHVALRLHGLEGAPFDSLARGIFLIAGTVLAGLLLLYLFQALTRRAHVRADFSQTQMMNFSPSLAMAIILCGAALYPFEPGPGGMLIVGGTFLGLFFAVLVVRGWLTNAFKPQEIGPAWFFPVAGNLLAAQHLADLGLDLLALFVGGLGFFGWLMVLPIIFRRLILATELTPMLLPSLFILIAPPGLAASAALAMLPAGAGALLAAMTLGFGLFLLTVLISLRGHFEKAPFSMSWWAYTFPTAALASGALDLAMEMDTAGLIVLAEVLASLNLALTAGVGLVALFNLRKGKRPLPE